MIFTPNLLLVIQQVDATFGAQTKIEMRKPAKHRKREVRVFVSSTFRDFKKEREELIKKTFREVTYLAEA